MQAIITKDYNGYSIAFEIIDGQLMVNATEMCAAFGKRPYDWQRSTGIARYIAALEAKRENLVGEYQLVTTRTGVNAGTWIHEKLILKLAQWLDVDFEVQCDEWVAELLRTGRVELAVRTPAELILMQAQQLVDHERRVTHLEVRQDADHKQIGVLGEQVAEVAAKQTTIDTAYYTVSGYASLNKIKVPLAAAIQYGKQAAAMSREQDVPVDSTYDSKYGKVNTYHADILKQVFSMLVTLPVRLPGLRPAARR